MRKMSSLMDQALVSGGNFLTIASCAHFLTFEEQGKLTYVFACYMALLLFNVAGIFQGAAVRAPSQEQSEYKTILLRLQAVQALLLTIVVCAIWYVVGAKFDWQATQTEIWALFVFLLLQQLADFDRRSAYIFTNATRALLSSAMVYPLRIAALLVLKPDTIEQVLIILLATALLPGAITIRSIAASSMRHLADWLFAVRQHLSYSRLFIAGIPLSWLSAYIPIFLLGGMYGKEQVAILGSIRGISNVANVLMEQLETKVVADWARSHHKSGGQALDASAQRIFWLGSSLWLMGMFVILVWGTDLLHLILSAKYEPYWGLLILGWLSYGMHFLVRMTGIKQRVLGKNQVEFTGIAAGLVVAAIAGFILIPAYASIGAAWTYVVMGVAMYASQLYLVRKIS